MGRRREGVSRAALVQDIPRRVHGTLAETERIMRDTFFVAVYPGLAGGMADSISGRVRRV